LVESGEEQVVRGMHAAHFVGLGETAEPEFEGPGS
jgi:hypothetical protein